MEKSVQARRKAQQLAREGRVQQAIEEMRKLLSDGEVDPYDHVYIGDLLVRVGQLSDAIDSWLLATRHYEQAGLNRNAIAICKKILRLDPRRHTVHRVLGDLYVLDGLWGEAVPHFLVYLDSVSGDECFGPTFLETLEKAVSVVGLQIEAALRLADHYIRVNRGDRASELLLGLVDQLSGSEAGQELVEELRARAQEARAHCPRGQGAEGDEERTLTTTGLDAQLCQDLEARGTEPWPPGSPSRLHEETRACDVGFDGFDAAGFSLAAEISGAPEDPAVGPTPPLVEPPPAPPQPAGDLVVEHLGAVECRETVAPEPESNERTGGEGEGSELGEGAAESSPREVGGTQGEGDADRIWDLDESSGPVVLDWPEEPDAAPAGERAVERQEPAAGAPPAASIEDPTQGPAGLLERAETAFRSGDWHEAQRLFERALVEHPLEPQSLGRLVEVARALGDGSAETRYQILLGDAWIEAGELEKACAAFLEVHRMDPENGTARRRIARFREMGVAGAEAVTPPPEISVLSVLESGDARVTVEERPQAAKGTQDWMELGALLEAFQEGLKNQIAGDDYQSHYDLAVSHRAMGLLEEAIDEADQALQCPSVPAEVECLARELKGLCLSELERHREALHEFRAALEHSTEHADRRRSLRYRLAVALESVGEWQEAAETFEAILSESPEDLDAAERRDRCLKEWLAQDAEEKAA